MRRMRRGGAMLAGVALAIFAIVRARAASPPVLGPAPLANDAGPVVRAIPEGAFVAEDEGALRRALDDASGPTDIWLRARTYNGDFTVKRPLALHGEKGATLEGSGTGTVLAIETDDVTVENLTVRHSGHRHTVEDSGIKAKGARIRIVDALVEDTLFGVVLGPCPHCVVQHTHVRGPGQNEELNGDGIKLWESHDAEVNDCLMEDSRDLVVWYSKRVKLIGNTVRRSRYGSHFMYAHDAEVRNSRIENNIVGIFAMYSERVHITGNVLAGARGPAGVGIGFKESDGVQVTDNWIVANTTGAYLDRTPRAPTTPVLFRGNVFALNDVALQFHSSAEGLSFESNDMHQNVTVAEVEGGGDALGVRFEGNRWSDYAGYDLDGDGRGDVAFEVKQLSGELTDAHPALKFFEGTAAMGIVDAIAHAVPVLAAHRMLIDESPATVSPIAGSP